MCRLHIHIVVYNLTLESKLDAGLVHGDPNHANILVHPAFCGRDLHQCADELCAAPHVLDARTAPVGCLDWQDLRHSCPVFDLAICAAYVLLRAVGARRDLQPPSATTPTPTPTKTPTPAAAESGKWETEWESEWERAVRQTLHEVARGYEAAFGLERAERECLALLVATRLAVSLAVGQYTFRVLQREQHPEAYLNTARSRGEHIMNTLLHLHLARATNTV